MGGQEPSRHLQDAVNLQRIDATDEIGAVANGRIEQVEDARTAHHAALRERNDLHRCPIAITLACGKYAFQLRKAAFEVNVDMGAQVAGTRATHSRIRLPARSSVDSGKYGRIVLSVSMRLMRVGPTACPIHGRPVSVLPLWTKRPWSGTRRASCAMFCWHLPSLAAGKTSDPTRWSLDG
jgi:hypothetical protein